MQQEPELSRAEIQSFEPAVSSQPAPTTETPQPEKASKNPAGKVGMFVLLVFATSLAWHVASDLIAPGSSSGAVAASTTQMAARVPGQVSEIFVADNQRVKLGDRLFALDPASFDLAVRQAELALEQAILAADASTVNLTGAEAQVEQALANLEHNRTTMERTSALFERGLLPRTQLDAAELQLTSAQSSLEAARAALSAARLQSGAGEHSTPQVEAARVQLEQALLNREFATVTAPADGVITNLQMAVGQFVNAGSPALTFIESDQRWIVVDLRENR